MRRWATLFIGLAACGRLGFGPTEETTDGSTASGDDANVDSVVPLAINSGTTSMQASYGGTANEEGYDVAVSSTGAVAVTGTLQSSFMVGSTAVGSVAGDDIIVSAFAADGTPAWTSTLGGGGGDRGQAIAFDSAGNIYVSGLYASTVNFFGTNKTAAGMWDMFVVSYAPSGAFRWVTTAGGVNGDFAYDVIADSAGNVIVTGYYDGAVDFGMGPLPAAGANEAFVAKYNGSTGALLWARGFTSAGSDTGQGVAVDAAGRIYVTGNLGGAIDFGGGPVGAAGGAYLLALDSAGNYLWATTMKNTLAWDVALDAGTSQLLVAARVSTAGTDVGDGMLLPTYGGSDDNMVVAFTLNGTLAWHRESGGDLSDIGLGVTSDGTGNVYLIGLGGTALNGAGANAIQGNGMQDIYVIAYDATHTPRWGKMYGGAAQDRGYAVAVAPDGALWITGRYAGTADFGKGAVTSAGGNDLFLTKLY
ncbi:MAG TPA: SBBP repeat-containing protein [Kofleriaceae bacterium]|nr:SBBP repeat-containing protein [Kofleriaceae bacterium]